MCTGCWELRTAHVASLPQPRAPGSAGLVLGLVSLLPLPPLQLLSLIVNVVSLAKMEPGRSRWRPMVGLGLTVAGGLLTLLMIILAN